MVKAFDNYAFARDAWTFLVSPAWYHEQGLVRVGSLVTTGAFSAHLSKPQLMPGPIRPGTLVYSQEVPVRCEPFLSLVLILCAKIVVSAIGTINLTEKCVHVALVAPNWFRLGNKATSPA